jgi:hypothetical protein
VSREWSAHRVGVSQGRHRSLTNLPWFCAVSSGSRATPGCIRFPRGRRSSSDEASGYAIARRHRKALNTSRFACRPFPRQACIAIRNKGKSLSRRCLHRGKTSPTVRTRPQSWRVAPADVARSLQNALTLFHLAYNRFFGNLARHFFLVSMLRILSVTLATRQAALSQAS